MYYLDKHTCARILLKYGLNNERFPLSLFLLNML